MTNRSCPTSGQTQRFWLKPYRKEASVRLLQASTLLLALDHLDDELLHVGVAGGLDVTGLRRLAVALQRPPLGKLVELRPVDLHQHPLVLGEVLADLGAG